MTADDLKKIIEDEFKKKLPESIESKEVNNQSNKCFDDIFQSAKAAPAGDRVKIEIKGDFSACINATQVADKSPKLFEFKVGLIHMYLDIYCEGADFSKLKGQSPFVSEGSHYKLLGCEKIKNGNILYNGKFDYKYDIFLFGKQEIEQTTLSAIQDKSGNPCQLGANGSYKESCFKLNKEVTSGEVQNIFDKSKESQSSSNSIIHKNYEYPPSFSSESGQVKSGGMNFKINNWSGSFEFLPNSKKWKAQDKNAQEAEGEFL